MTKRVNKRAIADIGHSVVLDEHRARAGEGAISADRWRQTCEDVERTVRDRGPWESAKRPRSRQRIRHGADS